MSFTRLVSKPFERLPIGVNTVEVAAVGASVFTIGWLVRHFHGGHPLSEPDEIEGEETDSADCLEHEEVSDFWRSWYSDRFLSTESCFHPLERIKSYDLELAKSEVIPSEAESVKPLSLVLNDGISSSYSSAPECVVLFVFYPSDDLCLPGGKVVLEGCFRKTNSNWMMPLKIGFLTSSGVVVLQIANRFYHWMKLQQEMILRTNYHHRLSA